MSERVEELSEDLCDPRSPSATDERMRDLRGRDGEGRSSSREVRGLAGPVEVSRRSSLPRADALEILGRPIT